MHGFNAWLKRDMQNSRKLDENMEQILSWYDKNRRSLPWRDDPTPYHVWVSEIMLQQTRVEAVKPYYARFLEHLPTIRKLAECPENELLKLWEGLGYYNRVRNMQKAAQTIVKEYGGEIPADFEKIRALPGIGDYTAGAIASIAYGINAPAVDGNALRIYTRYHALSDDIAKEKTKEVIRQQIAAFMKEKIQRPGDFNQALMDLGAGICLPHGEPHCEICPLAGRCKAHQCGSWEDYPVKTAAKKRRIEEHTILIISDYERVLIVKRPEKGLLAGLYEYPNLEGYPKETELVAYAKKLGLDPLRIEPIAEAKHIFSHIEWHMKGFLVRISEAADLANNSDRETAFVNKRELENIYAIPSAYKVYTEYAKRMSRLEN